jgi:C-terminal processing protease CtpA/Prc
MSGKGEQGDGTLAAGAGGGPTAWSLPTAAAAKKVGVGLMLERKHTGISDDSPERRAVFSFFVIKLMPNSPAFTNGQINPNDRLISVDSAPVGDMQIGQVFEMINGMHSFITYARTSTRTNTDTHAHTP